MISEADLTGLVGFSRIGSSAPSSFAIYSASSMLICAASSMLISLPSTAATTSFFMYAFFRAAMSCSGSGSTAPSKSALGSPFHKRTAVVESFLALH